MERQPAHLRARASTTSRLRNPTVPGASSPDRRRAALHHDVTAAPSRRAGLDGDLSREQPHASPGRALGTRSRPRRVCSCRAARSTPARALGCALAASAAASAAPSSTRHAPYAGHPRARYRGSCHGAAAAPAGAAGNRARDQAARSRPAALRAPAAGAGRARVPLPQVPLDDGGCRRAPCPPARSRPGGSCGMGRNAQAALRSADHAARPFPAPQLPR